MPTKDRREDALIDLFLSAYEDGAWANCHVDRPEKRMDGAVEAVATKADGTTLAIEHTLIEPFVGDREDIERLRLFEPIGRDQTLLVPGQAIFVYVPVGALRKGDLFRSVVDGVREWIREHRLTFPEGKSRHALSVPNSRRGEAIELVLWVQVFSEPQSTGTLIVSRHGQEDPATAVEKALKNKVPKLVGTDAKKHILMLERHQLTLSERTIVKEVDDRRQAYPDLDKVEVWIVETVGYDVGYVCFTMYKTRDVVSRFSFSAGMRENEIPG